jgi:type I restriction enzyme S subunit
MPNNWKTYKLGEIVDVKQGLAINKKTDHLLTDKSSMPLFKIRDLINNTVEHYVKEDEVPKQCIANYEDLIYSRTGQVGLVFRGKIGCIHNNCFKIIPNESIINKDLLFWFLKQPEIIEYANNIASGSVQKDLNHTAFKSIEISISDNINEQKNIAEIFNIINDKIENNLAINKTIEEMAMALYKHWFVDFGPFQDGEFVESELGKIPKGWEVKKITDLIEVKDGTHDSPKRVEDGFYLITSKHIMTNSIDFSSAYKISCDDYIKINKRSLVEKGDILMTMIGTVGNFYFVNEDPNYVIKNLGLFKTSKSPLLKIYLFSFFNSKIGQEYIKSQMTGSTQQYVTLKTLRNFDIIVPDEQILEDYNHLANDYFEKILINIKENQTLTQLRDTLLPKLISGEVRLKEFQES